MRFNKQELLTLASQSSHKYEKEGVLILREKSDSFFRRGESNTKTEKRAKPKRGDSLSCIAPNGQASTERWFRLAGNLLFYLKTRDHWSEPVGVIVLENYTVKVDPRHSTNSHQGHHFVIDFVSGGYHLLAALSETERASWMSFLKNASFASMRAKVATLRVQIQTRIALNRPTQSPLSLPGGVENDANYSSPKDRPKEIPIKACGYVKDLSEAPLFEFSFTCDNLPADSHGRLPNSKIVIHVRNSKHQEWIKYSSTEIVEKLSNPVFLTTVSFRESDGVREKSQVRLTVYDVRERFTQTQTVVGHLMVHLNAFKRVPRIRLPLIPPTPAGGSNGNPLSSAGFITVQAWNPEREERTSTESTPCRGTAVPECPSNYGFFAHRRTQSLPPRLGSKLKIPLQTNFDTLCSNPFMQTYRFHSGLGGDIFVQEIMAESKLSFLFPQQLLSAWITEEKELLQEMIGLGELREPWHSNQVAILERHLWLINAYTQARQNLVNHKGTDFKLSSTKTSSMYEFVPLNLHMQRIWVQNESLHKSGFHDAITVGAFTAHAQGFSDGGLVKQVHNLQQFGTSRSYAASWYVTNKVNMMYDVVQSIKRLRREIVDKMQTIMKLAKERKVDGLHLYVEDIYSKCQQLMVICDQSMIEEAFTFYERHKLTFPTSTSLDFEKLSRSNSDDIARFIDEGVDTPNSPMRSAVELFKKRNEMTGNIFDKKSEDQTPDSGLGVEEIVKSFLDAPCCNYYRPTEEPEPWDLTLVNIQASVISLNSKVKGMCGVGADIDTRKLRPIQRAHSVKVNPTMSISSDGFGSPLKSDKWRKSLREELPFNKEKNVKGSKLLAHFIPYKPNLLLSLPVNPESIPTSSTVNESSDLNGVTDWSEESRASVKKLRLALDGLLKTSRLAHGIYRLQEHTDKWKLHYTVKYRRDVCFSQALTTLVTAIMMRLWCRKPDPTFLFILMRLGPLVNFSGLLTYQGNEAEMLSDMIVAIEDLKTVDFWLVPHETKSVNGTSEEEASTGNSNAPTTPHCPVPRVYGWFGRSNLKVILPIPEALYVILPLEPGGCPKFTVTPVFFNIGINDKASIAERLGSSGPMDRSNADNFNRLSDYFRQFQKLVLPIEFSSKRHPTPEADIGGLIADLEVQLSSKKRKNVDILHLSAHISRRMLGLRFISCKSGKDRTSMGATLEQCQILSQEYDLAEYEFPRALDAMRSEGCRRENTLKNIGKRKYAFNSLQVYALPTLYRPPTGTFGSAQT